MWHYYFSRLVRAAAELPRRGLRLRASLSRAMASLAVSMAAARDRLVEPTPFSRTASSVLMCFAAAIIGFALVYPVISGTARFRSPPAHR
jgi:hypothetical protein